MTAAPTTAATLNPLGVDAAAVRSPRLHRLRMQRAGFATLLYAIYAALARDPQVVLITFPTFIVITAFLATIRSRFISFEDVLHFLSLLFFVISPLQSLAGGYFSSFSPTEGIRFTFDEVALAQAIFLAFYTPFVLALRLLSNRPALAVEVELPASAAPAFAALSLVALILYILASGGLSNLFAARYDKDLTQIDFANLPQLAVQVVCTFAVASYVFKDGKTSSKILLLICLTGLLLAQNPFNTSRNFLLACYLPLILMHLRGRLGVGRFYAAVLLAIVFVMPVFNYTSREGYTLQESLAVFDLSESLRTPYSDVFDTLTYETRWFQNNSFAGGQKTVGLLLFFVPRAIWAGKPTLTGLDLGGQLFAGGSAGTPNLSFFVGGDFYADGGLLAAALGGGVMAIIVYLAILRSQYTVNGQPLKQYMFVAALPILLRGPLAANVGLLFFELITLYVVTLSFGRKRPTLERLG